MTRPRGPRAPSSRRPGAPSSLPAAWERRDVLRGAGRCYRQGDRSGRVARARATPLGAPPAPAGPTARPAPSGPRTARGRDTPGPTRREAASAARREIARGPAAAGYLLRRLGSCSARLDWWSVSAHASASRSCSTRPPAREPPRPPGRSAGPAWPSPAQLPAHPGRALVALLVQADHRAGRMPSFPGRVHVFCSATQYLSPSGNSRQRLSGQSLSRLHGAPFSTTAWGAT